ncbi:lysophospholipase [Litorimonas cladophorae]|uniref:Lysophospholipase n=1 Tax=Litorimonas cladophorae TaxID=1220491 RepID=A0A918KTF7_9PROT|nr:alpha/beta hydrolase [Litorimonas cladophorae]GGX75415.1 lysophospholipase [Litorimonas cladophorae]
MSDFTCNSTDGTQLIGRHWPVEAPKAVMALVHGFGEHCGRYELMATYLNAHKIAVVGIDLRGHGRSPGPRGVIHHYDDFRADLAALLSKTRKFYVDTPMVLYGHSMGGGLVLDHDLQRLDKMPIIASAPLIKLTEPIPKPVRVIAKLIGKINPNGAMSQPIDGTKISNIPAEQALYMEDELCHGRLGFRLAEGMVSTGENIEARASEWDRPLLLLHSEADQLTGFDGSARFAHAAKQVEFHAFETPQHEMHNDLSRDDVYTLMRDFILSQSEPKTA